MSKSKSARAPRVPEGWYGVSEVSQKTRVPVATLRRWRKTGVLVPSGTVVGGNMFLYSDDDVQKILAYRSRPRT